MGALRAAELHSFGMVGIGRIFEAFRDGILEDDDEVALHHGPAQTGYIPLSEPMVNIRATLECALKQDIISKSAENQLIDLAKYEYYPKRNWKNLLSLGHENMIAKNELVKLEKWLPENRIDQKFDDAISMLNAMSEYVARGQTNNETNYHLEWTVMWDKAVWTANQTPKDRQQLNNMKNWILDELRLKPRFFTKIQKNAIARFVAEETNIQENEVINTREIQKAITLFRSERGLLMKTQLDNWLIENDLDMIGLENLIRSDLMLAQFCRSCGDSLNDHLLAELRLTGAYSELAKRARCKNKLLEKTADSNLDRGKANIGAMQLRMQFFQTHFEQQIPDDLNNFLHKIGFNAIEEFDRMLARENIFMHNGSVKV